MFILAFLLNFWNNMHKYGALYGDLPDVDVGFGS